MKNIILNPNVKQKCEKKYFEIWLLLSHFVPHYCEPARLQVEEKIVWMLKNFQKFFKEKKSVRGNVGDVTC